MNFKNVILVIFLAIQTVRLNAVKDQLAFCDKNSQRTVQDLQRYKAESSACEDANYELSSKVQYAQSQEEYLIDRCGALVNRLKLTTDYLENTTRCALYKQDLSHCGVSLKELVLFMNNNRKSNF
jgi:hypothetical protein